MAKKQRKMILQFGPLNVMLRAQQIEGYQPTRGKIIGRMTTPKAARAERITTRGEVESAGTKGKGYVRKDMRPRSTHGNSKAKA